MPVYSCKKSSSATRIESRDSRLLLQRRFLSLQKEFLSNEDWKHILRVCGNGNFLWLAKRVPQQRGLKVRQLTGLDKHQYYLQKEFLSNEDWKRKMRPRTPDASEDLQKEFLSNEDWKVRLTSTLLSFGLLLAKRVPQQRGLKECICLIDYYISTHLAKRVPQQRGLKEKWN